MLPACLVGFLNFGYINYDEAVRKRKWWGMVVLLMRCRLRWQLLKLLSMDSIGRIYCYRGMD